MKKLLAFILALMLCFSLLVSCNLPGGEQESEESVCGGKDDSFNFIDCEHNWERIDNLNESTARDECTKCGEIRLYTDPESLPKHYNFSGLFYVSAIEQNTGFLDCYSRAVLDILNRGLWEKEIAEVEFDYIFKINGHELYYDEESGVFANFAENRQMCLTDSEKDKVMSLLGNVFLVDFEVPDVLIRIEKWNVKGFEGVVADPLISYLESGDKVSVEMCDGVEADEEKFPVGVLVKVRFAWFDASVDPDLLFAEAVTAQSVLEIEAEDMTAGVTANSVTVSGDLEAENTAAIDFALRLFNAANEDGKSTLVSPVSVLYALAMTANGAEGETRAQMEETLGMSVEELNLYLYTYMQKLPQGEKYKLNIANSIWFTDDQRFTVNQSFLQKNADYYGADIYKSAFDEQTLKDINNWVNYQTDGLIPKALDEIPEEALMYIINAILFDAEWESPYNEYSVYDGKFTTEDGRELEIEMMWSEESRYLEDESSTGFIKYYNGRKYAFAAILPNEGMSVSEYLATLDGEKLSAFLSESRGEVVYATMPKFESGSDFEMAEILSNMGIVDAFSSVKADFSGLGESSAGKIYISRVIHKTFIEVAEKGTRAGAVTIIEATDECAPMDPKTVKLDRPFIYMLIDCENNIPFFIGTMMGN